MAESPVPQAPKGLSRRGRSFWKAVVSGYKLRPDELILLETAARSIDKVDALEQAMAGEPLTVKGSMGQIREHPLLAEARQQRALLNRTLAQLDLPDDESKVQVNPHRAAGKARWSYGSNVRRWTYGE